MAEYIERDYEECITKHRAKHFVCEFCNEHCSDEPCEPSDCEWMQYIESEPAADVVERGSFEAVGQKYAQIQDKLIRGEIAPVVHSKWVKDRDGDEYCENCSRYMPVREVTGDPSATDYCPNCGARMDGE